MASKNQKQALIPASIFGNKLPARIEPNRVATRDELRVQAASDLRQAIIEEYGDLGRVAQDEIRDTYTYSQQTYASGISEMHEVRGQPRTPDEQRYVDSYTHEMNIQLGRGLAGIVKATQDNIMSELQGGLHPAPEPPEPPRPRSLKEKLWG